MPRDTDLQDAIGNDDLITSQLATGSINEYHALTQQFELPPSFDRMYRVSDCKICARHASTKGNGIRNGHWLFY
jgi:hypothetical protein